MKDSIEYDEKKESLIKESVPVIETLTLKAEENSLAIEHNKNTLGESLVFKKKEDKSCIANENEIHISRDIDISDEPPTIEKEIEQCVDINEDKESKQIKM
eukprot:TRINITY_DN30975_c0_g1_i1.p2 TRINITY_DN30975_c0_g1~~TRINITY_DN30975_c0_g1_i1.p2  ORF type:complete len:101 (-),score=22.25 TRINITY_DN30975_c0_g1_i1:227-529(-)